MMLARSSARNAAAARLNPKAARRKGMYASAQTLRAMKCSHPSLGGLAPGRKPGKKNATALAVHMSRLTEIPIPNEPPARIESPAEVGGLGGGAAAILSELVTLLERLALGEAPGAIDLHSLPMSSLDRAELRRVLGDGEVQARVNAQGLSRMRETRVSGVSWVERFNPQGELVAELIDVSRVPEIAAGARALRAQISTAAAPAP
jgi:hypothetical protein